MTDGVQATQITPEVLSLKRLVDEIPGGTLRVPRFQRPYVWNRKDMLDLFDSIHRGYPVGSLLLWETDQKVQSLSELGPLTFGPDSRPPTRMILDGHQRLATLAGCLLPRSDNGDSSLDQWTIYYDLEGDRFVHGKRGEIPKTWFPLRSLLRTVDFIRESRKVESPLLVDKAEQLAERFKNYQIAVVTIRGGDLSRAVDIFSRLNNQGKAMTPDQMISALTFDDTQQSLADCVDSLEEFISEHGFGSVRRGVLFQILLAALDIEPRVSNAEELANKLKREKKGLNAPLESAKLSLDASLNFLSTHVGVTTSKLLPYAPQLLLLCEYFRNRQDFNADHNFDLQKWFWHTSWSGWFAGANDSLLVEALKGMKEFAASPDPKYQLIEPQSPIRPLPAKFDARSARIRAFLACWFKLHKPLRLDGETVSAAEILNQGTLPYVYNKGAADPGLLSSPANRAFWVASERAMFHTILQDDDWPQYDGIREALASYGFDPEVTGGPTAALKARLRRFQEGESVLMRIFGLDLPQSPGSSAEEEALEDDEG